MWLHRDVDPVTARFQVASCLCFVLSGATGRRLFGNAVFSIFVVHNLSMCTRSPLKPVHERSRTSS
jgi:hypothetical protein